MAGPFKPVGIDDDALFPGRVETRLSSAFGDDAVAARIGSGSSATRGALTAAVQVLSPRRGIPTEFSQMLAALQGGRSTAICLVGDSTGNEAWEWFHLTALALLPDAAAYTVHNRVWNVTTQTHDAPVVLQTGAGGERHMVVNTSDRIALADAPANRILGDLDVRIKFAPDVWASGEQTIAAKYGASGNRGWRLFLNSSGKPCFEWTEDGTTSKGIKTGSTFVNPADGASQWLRVVLDVDNGASGHDVMLYTSSDGATWTQLGSTFTSAGVTSIFNSTSDLQIGARSGFTSAPGGSPMVGKVYYVEVRNGIDGPTVAPVLPESWTLQSTGIAPVGAPIFTIVNSSHPGATLVYLIDQTRLGKMTPDYGQALTLLSCSHNDGVRYGPRYLADWDTLLATVRSRLPLSGVALSTQNPRTEPAANIIEHGARRSILMQWAATNRLGLVDAYAAFLRDPRTLAALIKTDGVHPNEAGSEVWAAEALAMIRGA